jgi:hypothetical protein
MISRVLKGTAAGAAGTATLNLITYLDMLVRARASSTVPADTATRISQAVGIELTGHDEDATHSRRTAAGALLGFGAGLGLGVSYAMVDEPLADLPASISGTLLGAAAMAASDVPATATGATDPRSWGTAGWLADIIPHLGYGLVTVLVYRALRRS